jgi:DNA-binding response OmpR family regulator
LNARSVRPDRLLEGEDPDTQFASDVRHWIAVYREMIGFNEDLLGRLEDQLKRLPMAARDGAVDDDVSLIAGQLERYRRRLGYWYERQWQLEGLEIDHDERTVAYRGRAIAFTRREFQLFVLLVSRSPNFISPSRLLVEAWHDGQLPEETLRTYIARVRAKLASLGAAVTIKNQPRRGYALVFSEARE